MVDFDRKLAVKTRSVTLTRYGWWVATPSPAPHIAIRITMGPTRSRGTRHCRICPGAPLTVQCIHTKTGKKFLLLASGRLDDEPHHNGALKERHQDQTESPLAQQPTSQSAMIGTQNQSTDSVGMPVQSQTHSLSWPPRDGPSAIPLAKMANVGDTMQSNMAAVNILDAVLDPLLRGSRSDQHDPVTPRRRDMIGPSSEQCQTPEDDVATPRRSQAASESESDSDTETATPGDSKHQKGKKKGAKGKFGMVEGVMRGNTQYNVERKRRLPPLAPNATTAARRFTRTMGSVLRQLERISAETGGWLFLAGQHPNAGNQFIHYTSKRLLKDAKPDAEKLINQFNVVVNGLMYARRKDALEIGKALVEARQDVERAGEEVRAAQDALEEREKEIAEKNAEIAKYKARLGIE